MAALPTRIGRYRIERLLGSGSMGNVYLGHDDDLDREVAVKTLRDLALDAETRELFVSRFQNEARAAARLHHPNIVQIFDVGDDPEVGPYLVFEYVRGHTLKDELKRTGPLSRARLLEVGQQVADALSTAHAAGVIHRDLKPENLLITENGQVKLADFGIARVPNADLTKEGQFLGTPCYSAPETLKRGEYSEKSDLFSFGAVMYEAASGERAFPGAEAMAVAHNVMNKDPVPPSEANRGARIPPPVDAAITRALDKNPSRRYASARTFVSALREAYDGRRPAKTSRRSTTIPFVMVIALGAVIAVWVAIEQGRAIGTDTRTSIDGGTIADAGSAGAADAEPATDAMSPHEREEAAKDELERARAALETGDLATANAALDAAAELDPTNPDIADLRARLGAVAPDAG